MTPPGPRIADRMADYFERQIAHFEDLLRNLDSVESTLAEEDISSVATDHASQERATLALADEFWSLNREWETTEGISGSDRKKIQTLARKADGLVQRIGKMLDESAEITQQHKETISEAMGKMRQGKDALGKYRTEDPGGHNIVDRKA